MIFKSRNPVSSTASRELQIQLALPTSSSRLALELTLRGLKQFATITIVILFLLLTFSCGKNPIDKGKKKAELNVSFYFVRNIGVDSAEIFWACSDKAEGYVTFVKTGSENIQRSPLVGTIHFLKLTGLSPGTTYKYQAICKNEFVKSSLTKVYRFETFTTIQPLLPLSVIQRGIWILGGIGSDGNPVAQVDLFDPVDNKWYSNLTSIPTPRSFASIVSLKGKIYVIGGMTGSGTSATSSSVVEELTPSENSLTWKTLANTPVAIQGSLGGAVGDSIYLVGGAITTSVSSAVPNVVYKFSPTIGNIGTWVTINTLSSIAARIDLSGCVVDGTVFFNNGRDNSGNKQFTSDAYLPSTNSITAITEASFGLDRFGAGSACYRPKGSDPNPSDSPTMFIIGGSNNNNTSQPPSAIISTDRFEYYNTPSSSNTVTTGPNLPEKLYAPAAEISYEKRKLYVFGGASTVNIARNSIYSLDLANPSAGPWTTETITLPLARYGHIAVILSR